MKILNEIVKRFVVLFGVGLLAMMLCMLAEWCWRKLAILELLDRLQAHPVLFMAVILAVVALICAVLSLGDYHESDK